jgi:integrase
VPAPLQSKTETVDVARGPETPTLELLASFVRSRHDLRPSTLRGYAAGVRRFAKTYKRLRDLTALNANDYILATVRRKRRHMAHHDGRSLSIFSAWLVEARIITADPLAGVKVPPQPNTRRKPFKDLDVPLIIRTAEGSGCGERDVAIVVLALATGLRLNELRSLQWPEDFDIKRGFVYVRDRAAKTDASIRTVPVDPKAVAFVESYVLDHRPSQRPGALFLNRHGDPLTYDGFSAIFRRLRARLPADVDFKLHRARNTAITNWLRAGVDLHTTMRLAGHKSPKVTERYAGAFSDEELAQLTRPAFSLIYGKKAV